MKTIFTERLVLRKFTVEDVTEEYLKSLKDEEVIGLTEARHTQWTDEKALEYIKESNKEGISLLIGIFTKDGMTHIGNIRLSGFSNIHKRVDLGVMLHNKSVWGMGYGTEALIAVTNYVFSELKYHRIVADYYANNIGSARIFEKAGFKVEGIFKDHFRLKDKYIDSVRVGLVNNDG